LTATSAAPVDDLHARYRATGDPALREQLLFHYKALAHHFARRYANRGEPLDDLDQVALLALVKALDRFEPEREVKFSTYAARVISGELKRHFRDRTWAVRVPRPLQERYLRVRGAVEELRGALDRSPTIDEIATHLGLSDEDVLQAMDVASAYRLASLDAPLRHGGTGGDGEQYLQVGEPDRAMAAFEDRLHRRQVLAPLLEKLAEDDRLIVGLYYLHGLSQAEIARRLDVSQVQISRRLARILARLRSLAASAA
jgi:RNA polymerase sigma-B factor